MRAGRLRHLVTVQQLAAGSPQQKPTGEPDVAWAAYLSDIPAEISPVIGREFFAADQVQSKVDTKIRVRYEVGVTDGITASMRVLHGAVVYEIEAVMNVENRNRELLLMCATGVPTPPET